MNDVTAACRAALLKACWGMNLNIANEHGDSKKRHVVDVDDAAACMAEREAKLRAAIEGLLEYYGDDGACDSPSCPVCRARAALAAAQEER